MFNNLTINTKLIGQKTDGHCSVLFHNINNSLVKLQRSFFNTSNKFLFLVNQILKIPVSYKVITINRLNNNYSYLIFCNSSCIKAARSWNSDIWSIFFTNMRHIFTATGLVDSRCLSPNYPAI